MQLCMPSTSSKSRGRRDKLQRVGRGCVHAGRILIGPRAALMGLMPNGLPRPSEVKTFAQAVRTSLSTIPLFVPFSSLFSCPLDEHSIGAHSYFQS